MSNELSIDASFWDNLWKNQMTGWDIGYPSTPLSEYIKQYSNKQARILIPGCGNAHEAQFLLDEGFENITLVDISQKAVSILQEKYQDNPAIRIICQDFFEHEGEYDLILEQTFFCALPRKMRPDYVEKMQSLLAPDGQLVGVLFKKEFGRDLPPFGGSQQEYESLFHEHFCIDKMEDCHNSIPPRSGSELFITMSQK